MNKHSNGILVLNAGSSSIKFALFVIEGKQLNHHLHGVVERIGNEAKLHLSLSDTAQQLQIDAPDHHTALQQIFTSLGQHASQLSLIGVGHRVVHGGNAFQQPVLIDDDVEDVLQSLIPLAPLHQPHHLNAIRAVKQLHPQLPQVACFDTAFHQTMPQVAKQYALPYSLYEQGIRRYGFHGLSYEYINNQLPTHLGDLSKGRIIVAHLGNGASMCALHQGESIATTMGFTPLDGLPMGTRCGAIDPGVLLFLLQQQEMGVDQLQQLLYHQSGLMGMSGISSDMREILSSNAQEARQTVDYFIHRCCVEIGGLCASLGGVDALIFTGGIGEHANTIRAAICEKLKWLGVAIDNEANINHQTTIHSQESHIPVLVLPTDEERLVAHHTLVAIPQH